jgi:hypothetical protein
MTPLLKNPTKKDPNNPNNNRVKNDRDEQNSFQNTRLFNYVISSLLFAIGLLFLIVGVLYVTVYYYPYSFTPFSTNLCAGLFITFGSICIIIAVVNIISIRADRSQLVPLTTLIAFVLFVILLIIGIWGLIASLNTGLSYTVRENMQETIRNYDQSSPSNFATAKINWVQQTFNCCGIASYQDWRSFFLNSYGPYGSQQQQQPNYYLNQVNGNLNVPYTDNVPDSCCVQVYANCGKNFNQYPSSLVNLYGQNNYLGNNVNMGGSNYPVNGGVNGGTGYGNWGFNSNKVQNNNIYTSGCLQQYLHRNYRDLVFVAAYSFGVSAFGIIACVVYIILYFMSLKRT